MGYAQILQRDASATKKQQHGLNVIEQSGNHLLSLINDVLDLAKVESGKIELYQTDFHLPLFISGIGEIIRIRAEQNNIAFYLEQPDDLPLGVHGDERRLRQVLLNLLGNAVKFTDKGGVTLRVIKTEQNILRFEVQDTGVGISPTELDAIFDPFQQVGDHERQSKGTGLGLAISKNLIELMGGKLQVTSQFGSGSQFGFELPLPTVQYKTAQVAKTDQTIIGIEGKAPKVLVVDDNWENRTVFVDLLSSLGFDMLEANNGVDGLAKATEFQPDVILTDLRMPRMDGFELIRQLRQTPLLKNKLIIATSASAYEVDHQKSLTVGSNAFLPKPLQAESLFEQLQQHLNLKWVYGNKQTAQPMVFPPAEEMAVLYDLSQMGDIDEIEERVAALEQSNPSLKPFAKQMQHLIKGYQLNKISELLEAHFFSKNHK